MALDLTSPFDLTISQMILSLEGNDGRFESFCRDVVGQIEGGATIFSTSKSWDLGRDGVGSGSASGIYVCVSLRDDVDAKALTDLERIRGTTKKIRRIYFCSSHKLSEQRRSQLEAQLTDEVDGKSEIVCLGATQLTEAAAAREGLFEKYYGADLKGALRAISVDQSDEAELIGLRLALIAGTGENSVEIRNGLYAAALIDILSDERGRTLAVCAKEISERLRLAKVVSDAALLPHIKRLEVAELVSKEASVYKITEAGLDHAKQLRLGAADRFLKGKLSIRDSIERSIGEKLSEDDFQRVWNVFESRVAAYFHERGAQMVREISALLDNVEADDVPAQPNKLSFTEELAAAVAATSSHSQRRDELYTATSDIFTDRASGATEWLVRVCASYVACCALGLEYSSSTAIAKMLANTSLVLDTDVVLSLLGEGEPEHDSAYTVASKWPKLGGKLLVAESVLEEVAYHAWISENDFRQVRHFLPGSPEDRLRLIENVFVRSFAEHMSKGDASLGHWRRFIGQYAGSSAFDWSRCLALLKAEYSIDKLPLQSSEYDDLELSVKAFLVQDAERQGFHGKIARDKSARDARLYVGMLNYQRLIRANDAGATCLLVSSAHRLARTEREFCEAGEREFVVPISTVLMLLSLLPQVPLGLSAMKAFLFEDRRPGFSTDLERNVLRLLRSSHQVSLPWGKRTALMRELREKIVNDARQQGLHVRNDADTHALERIALSDANRERTIELLGEALDRVAVSSAMEDENARLRRENEELRARLEVSADRKR